MKTKCCYLVVFQFIFHCQFVVKQWPKIIEWIMQWVSKSFMYWKSILCQVFFSENLCNGSYVSDWLKFLLVDGFTLEKKVNSIRSKAAFRNSAKEEHVLPLNRNYRNIVHPNNRMRDLFLAQMRALRITNHLCQWFRIKTCHRSISQVLPLKENDEQVSKLCWRIKRELV